MLFTIYTLNTDTITDTILTLFGHILTSYTLLSATYLALLHDYCFEYTFLMVYLLPPLALS